jgi:E3 ubiquitin-protein ligase UBR1
MLKRECGLDDTCVMCAKCFNATNHENHEVYIYVSNAGGCCDCGDAEAWKIPLNCPYHSPKKSDEKKDTLQLLPEVFVERCRTLFGIILEFCLDVFSVTPFPETPLTLAEVKTQAKDSSLEEDRHVESFEDYVAVLWNDETHSFNEVIDIVMETLQCSSSAAKKLAEVVDEHVRIRHYFKKIAISLF